MKKIYSTAIALVFATTAFAQNDIQFSATDAWTGYMNVFELPANGGAYMFGSPWALDALKATPDTGANTLTLQPNFNTYADNPTDPYWVNQTTQEGNKQMEASTFVEPGPTFNGVDLTFSGSVLSYSLDTMYDVFVFIKGLDSLNGFQDAFGGSKIIPITSTGNFSVSATAAEIPAGLIIQYGFMVVGRNANPANEAALGSVVIGIDNTSLFETSKVEATLYPNPAQNELNIAIDYTITNVEIINTVGQVVYKGQENSINIEGLEAGTYMVRVQTTNGTAVTRFIKS
jgi:hypothetical protein